MGPPEPRFVVYQKLGGCFSVALPNASHCRLSSPCCLPFTKPKVSGCEQKTCSLVPLREKTKKKPVVPSLPSSQKPSGLSPWDATWVADPGTGASLCFRAESGVQAFLQGKPPQPSHNLGPWEWAVSLHIPVLPTVL